MPIITSYTGSIQDIDRELENPTPLNIAYPFIGNKDILDTNTLTIKNATSNILVLLHTEKGERRLQPNFGVSLRKYLFEPIEENTKKFITDELRSEINKWMGNEININSISVDSDNNTLIVNITISLKLNPEEQETISTWI